MMKGVVLMLAAAFAFASPTTKAFQTDTVPTSAGELQITFITHGSLLLTFNGKVIFADPFGEEADYSLLPKADVILVTHDHYDHLDSAAIGKIRTAATVIVTNLAGTTKVKDAIAMKNGDVREVEGFRVEAVPAYNILHKRPDGSPFHPKGAGNGYVVTFGDKRVYIAGDTENIPEMKNLKNIEVAFLPVNLPYTMTPEMAADAARMFGPRIVYPYHYGETDPKKIAAALKKVPGVEVRIRDMR